MNARTLLILAAVVAFGWSVRRWRTAIRAAMVLLVVEGALRKWVFPGAQDLMYFAKDVLLLGAYLGFFADRTRRRLVIPANPLLYGALAFAALVGMFQILNPNLPNVLVGILGFKAYFLYVPLMFILPAVFESDREVVRFLKRYAWIAIPVGVLAMVQFLGPSSSAMNVYARGVAEQGYVSTFGSSAHVRVTGPFAYITGYTSFLLAMSILILGILGTAGWRLRGMILLYVGLGLTLLGMLMSGSRGPVLLLVSLFPVYWWFAIVRERGTGATLGRLLLVGGLIVGMVVVIGDEAFTAFVGRARGVGDVSSRISSPLLAPYLMLPKVGLLGFGIGSTHQTAAFLATDVPAYSWLRGLRAEAESGRVMMELGPVGFVPIYFARIYIALFALQQTLRLRTRFHRALATASLLIFLAQVPGSCIFDVTAGVYYWFFAGLLMLVMRLDRELAPVPARTALRQARAPRMPYRDAGSRWAPARAVGPGPGGRWRS